MTSKHAVYVVLCLIFRRYRRTTNSRGLLVQALASISAFYANTFGLGDPSIQFLTLLAGPRRSTTGNLYQRIGNLGVSILSARMCCLCFMSFMCG